MVVFQGNLRDYAGTRGIITACVPPAAGETPDVTPYITRYHIKIFTGEEVNVPWFRPDLDEYRLHLGFCPEYIPDTGDSRKRFSPNQDPNFIRDHIENYLRVHKEVACSVAEYIRQTLGVEASHEGRRIDAELSRSIDPLLFGRVLDEAVRNALRKYPEFVFSVAGDRRNKTRSSSS